MADAMQRTCETFMPITGTPSKSSFVYQHRGSQSHLVVPVQTGWINRYHSVLKSELDISLDDESRLKSHTF
jgi:hypothetical protein